MGIKSDSCFSKRTGKPLTEYDTKYQAQEGADYANSTYDNDLSPYQCSHCELWHLSPRDRQTSSSKCNACVGGNGQYKDLYSTQEYAEKRASILYEERSIRLTAYKCPYYSGWHLTKG
jgi:hypothetical protein